MARVRTQKAVASRIDLNYHKKPHPWRRARVGLVALCTLAAGAWFAFSSVRIVDRKLVLVDAIHNPGPVTRAHAQIEQDCRACHDGDTNADGKPDSGYWLGVSDAACLKCHDGSLHHMNQKLADSHQGADMAKFVMAVKDDKHVGGAVSANCISCHIEHRGFEALAGTSDQHCVTCHENVNLAMKEGAKAETAARVVGFSMAEHPRFGRKLTEGSGWIDKTDVKFNHAKHMSLAEFSSADSCVKCHNVFEPPVGMKPAVAGAAPPYASVSDRSESAVGSSDVRYMQPVSFARHCVACHEMKLPAGGPTIPHQELSIVRAGLSDLPRALVDDLRALPAADRKKQLTTSKKESNRPGAKTIETTISEKDWVTGKLAALAKEVNKTAGTAAGGADLLKRAGENGDWLFEGAPVKGPNPTAMEFYVAFAASNSCVKCHSMNGKPEVMGVATAAPVAAPAPATGPAAAPASAPAAPATILATLPTGIPNSPQRWFPSSSFNHYSHRQMDCRGCHEAAWTSTKTEHVLTTDIDGQYFGAKDLGIATAAESCVSCHHASTAAARGAPSNCITCHEYHDHRFERSIDNPMISARRIVLTGGTAAAPTSQPATAAE